MSGQHVFSAGAAALVLALGCAGGDLTLPGSGAPAALAIVSGDGQQATAGAVLGEPLTVQLLDGSARPVSGIAVQFSFLGDIPGAGLDPATVLTDENGRAAAVVRLGRVLGEQVIVAQVAGTSDVRASFSATAVPHGAHEGHKQGAGGSHGDSGSE
jgi:hypothetical protein